jgi:hypothetical protein
MRSSCLRLSLVLVAIFALVSLGVAAPQGAHKPLRCGSQTKLDTVLNHPDEYFGKTVTVEGEMHRTFSDKVFSIEDDDFFRDDDLLIITNASKSDVVSPVKDSIAEGKDVCVTGVIQPFHRSEMESKFGPLNIESRASHYKDGSPVMIIERTQAVADTATTFDREKPLPVPAAEPVSEPVPTELETKSIEPESAKPPSVVESQPVEQEELPATASPLPLLGIAGLLALLSAAGLHLRLRKASATSVE